MKDTAMKCGENAPRSPAVALHSPSAFGGSQSSQLLHGPGFVSAPRPPAATHGPFRATTATPAPSVPVWWASPGPAQTLLPPRPHPRPPPAAPQHTQPPTGILSLRCGSPRPPQASSSSAVAALSPLMMKSLRHPTRNMGQPKEGPLPLWWGHRRWNPRLPSCWPRLFLSCILSCPSDPTLWSVPSQARGGQAPGAEAPLGTQGE